VSEAVPEALRVDVSPATEGTPALIVLSGEMDILSVSQFAEAMVELEQSSPEAVVIDVGGLTFIDSSGINALVQTARSVEERGGRVVLASPDSHVQRVFAITHVNDIVAVAADRNEALRLAATPSEPEPLADDR